MEDASKITSCDIGMYDQSRFTGAKRDKGLLDEPAEEHKSVGSHQGDIIYTARLMVEEGWPPSCWKAALYLATLNTFNTGCLRHMFATLLSIPKIRISSLVMSTSICAFLVVVYLVRTT